MKLTHTLLWLLWIAMTPFFVNGQPLIISETGAESYELKDYLKILEDPDEVFTIEDIVDSDSLTFSEVNTFYEFDRSSVFWGYVELQNNDPYQSNWIINFNRNDFVEVYIPTDTSLLQFKTGYLFPASEKQVTAGSYNVSLNLPPGTSTKVYFRLSQEFHYHNFDFELCQPTNLLRSDSIKYAIIFLFQGFLWVMILYSMLVYINFKDKAYLYYSLYIFFAAFFFMLADGIGREFILPEFPLATYFPMATLSLVSVFYYLFLRVFVDLDRLHPVWDKWLMRLIKLDVVITIVAVVLFFALVDKQIVSRISQYTLLFNLTVAVIFLITLFKAKHYLIRYFIWATAFLVVGSSFDAIFWDSYNTWGTVTRIGLIGEILFFSLGLGKRMKVLEQSKRKVQGDLLRKLRSTEEQLSKQKFDLEEMVEERTRQLEKQKNALVIARDQAQEAARAKTDFLSVMSHEIRTPMNGVIGMTHLLLQENPKPDQLDNLKSLKLSAENLLLLLNDILDYNKLESGMIEIEAVDFSIKELVRNIRYQYRSIAEDKGIKLAIDIDPEIPEWLKGDPGRLNQILTNLISNAIKFTSEGEVRLAIKLKKLKNELYHVDFSVSDTGIGIPREKLPVIFNRFTQASSDTSRKFGGTGLGLAITKRLLELHESRIFLDSVLDEGSKFYFTLKLKQGEGKDLVEDRREIEKKIHELKGVKVLAVDDNQMNRLILEKFLKKWEMDYDNVDSGKKALELIMEKDYDIMLLDLQMPNMNGYEVTEKIRSFDSHSLKNLPIVALSADIFANLYNKVVDAGMDDFVSKPFNPDELAEVIYRYTVKNKVAANQLKAKNVIG